jgi:hypothetical protein
MHKGGAMSVSRNITKQYGDVLISGTPVLTTEETDQVTIMNESPSYSPDTGSFVVGGGMGVKGSVFVQGEIVPLGGINMSGGRLFDIGDPVGSGDAVTLGFFMTNAGGVVAGTGIVKDINTIHVSGSLPHVSTLGTILNGTWQAGTVGTTWGGTGRTSFGDGQIVFGGGAEGSALGADPTFKFNSSTKSLSLLGLNEASGPDSGTLTVSGGVGVGKSLYARSGIITDGLIRGNLLQDVTDTNVGSFHFAGGGTVGRNLRVLGDVDTREISAQRIHVLDSAHAADVSTAPMVLDGGIGVKGRSIYGSELRIEGPLLAASQEEASNVGYGSLICNGGMSTRLSTFVGRNLTVAGTSNLQSLSCSGVLETTSINVTSSQESLGVGSGSISTMGGLSAKRASFFGSDVRAAGRVLIDSTDEADESRPLGAALVVSGGAQILGRTIFNSDVTVKGKMQFSGVLGFEYLSLTADVESTAPGTGTCVVTGGASISRTLRSSLMVVHGNVESISTSTGALVVSSGGFGCAGNGHFGGRLLVGASDDALGNMSGSVVTEGGLSVGRTIRGEADLVLFGNARAATMTAAAMTATGTAEASSLGEGTFRCEGGGSIRGNLFIGGYAVLSGSLTLRSGLQTAGPIILDGTKDAVIVKGQLNGGAVNVTTVKATGSGEFASITSGGDLLAARLLATATGEALVVEGSASIRKDITVSGSGTFVKSSTGTASVTSPDDAVSLGNAPFSVVGGCSIRRRLFVGGESTFSSSVVIADGTPADPSGRAALLVKGGLYTTLDAFFNAAVTHKGASIFDGPVSSNGPFEVRTDGLFSSTTEATDVSAAVICQGGILARKNAVIQTSLSVGAGSVLQGPVLAKSTVRVEGSAVFADPTGSSGPGSGSIVTLGGIGCVKNAQIGGTLQVNGGSTFLGRMALVTSDDRALEVSGGISAAKVLALGTVEGSMGNFSTSITTPGQASVGGLRVTGTSPSSVTLLGGLSAAGMISTSAGVSASFMTAIGTVQGKSLVATDGSFTGDVDASGPSSGTLKVLGGISATRGIYGGALRIAGTAVHLGTTSLNDVASTTLAVTSPTDLDMAAGTAAAVICGGLLVKKSLSSGPLFCSGTFVSTDATDVSGTGSSASATFQGGVAIRKGLNIAGRLTCSSQAVFQGSVTSQSANVSGSLQVSSRATVDELFCTTQATVGGQLSVKTVNVTGQLPSTSAGTGCSTFAGGIGVQGPSFFASGVTAQGGTFGGGLSTFAGPVEMAATCTLTNPVEATMSGASLNIFGGVNIGKNVRVSTTVEVLGASSFAGPVRVKATEDSVDNVTAGCLLLDGGLGARGSISCGGQAVINGTLTARGNLIAGSITDVNPQTGSASLATAGGLFVSLSSRVGRNLSVGQALQVAAESSFNGPVKVRSTAGLSAMSGPALEVLGSQRVQGDLQVDGTFTCASLAAALETSAPNLRATSPDNLNMTAGYAALTSEGGFYCAMDAGVGGSMQVTQDLTVKGNQSLLGNLSCAARVSLTFPDDNGSAFGPALSVRGGVRVDESLVVSGSATSRSLRVEEDVTCRTVVADVLIINGMEGSSDLFSGSIRTSGGIAVRDKAYFGDSASFEETVSIGGDLLCAGSLSGSSLALTGTLETGSDASFARNISVGGDMTVLGKSTLGDISFTGSSYTFRQISVSSDEGVSLRTDRDIVCGGTLYAQGMTMEGSASIMSVTTDSITTGSGFVLRQLRVLGDVTLGASLAVAGGATFSSSVDVLSVFSAKRLLITDVGAEAIRCAGAVSAGGSLDVGGPARLSSWLSVGPNNAYLPESQGRGACFNVRGGTVIDSGPSFVETIGVSCFDVCELSSSTVAGSASAAATILVAGPPRSGAGRTITDSYAVLVEGGRVRIMDDTGSVSPLTGCLQLGGGLGLLGRVNGGSDASFAGSVLAGTEVRGAVFKTTSAADRSLFLGGIQSDGETRLSRCLVSDEATFSGNVYLRATGNAESSTVAPVLVSGGIGVSRDIVAGGRVRSAGVDTGDVQAASAVVGDLRVRNGSSIEGRLQAAEAGITGRLEVLGESVFSSAATFSANVAFASGAPATGPAAASVTVSGGLGVMKNIALGGDADLAGSVRVARDLVLSREIQLKSYKVYTPLSADTVPLTAGKSYHILMPPAGMLSSLTVTFPTVTDGSLLFLTSTKEIMQLLVTNGTFAPGMAPPSSLPAGRVLRYIYIGEVSAWFCM